MFSKPIIASGGAGGVAVHKIDQSIRFTRISNSSGNYMNRTMSSAGSTTSFTISFWFKVTDLVPSTLNTIVSVDAGGSSAQRFRISLNDSSIQSAGTDMQILITAHSTTLMLTKQIFRDPSAWYHLVYVWDYSDTVESERQRLYINGQRITDFETSVASGSGTLPSAVGWNTASEHSIGRAENLSGTGIYYLDAYVAEIVNIDGASLGPENFGQTNSSGIWIPKNVSSLTFGTNGFHITGANASYLGYDYAGSNHFSTTGSQFGTDDKMSDSPTNNWCVMNPLLNNGCSYTNGNLEVAPPNLQTTHRLVLPTMGISPSDTKKYYWEIKYLASDNSSSVNMLGVAGLDRADNPASATLNGDGDGYGLGYNTSTSNIYAGGNWTANGTPSWSGGFTNNAVYGVAYDGSTKRLYFYENNSALNSGNHFATYTGSAPLGPGASMYVSPSSSKLIFNMGANGFTYTPPTGYVAVNTTNLGS